MSNQIDVQRWWAQRTADERTELVEALWRDETLPVSYVPSLVGAGVDVYGYSGGSPAPVPQGFPFPDLLVDVIDEDVAA